MLLKDIFEQLSFGEFRKFGIGNDDQNGMQPADYRRVIPFISLALTELHKRFLLRSKSVIVQQYGHISRYPLENQFRQSDIASAEQYKYISDSTFEPFHAAQLLHIESICAEDGTAYPLNDNSKPFSLFTPEYNVVEIPYPLNENMLNVLYRADHNTLRYEGEGVDTQIVNLSPAYLETLLLHIAGRYLMSSGTAEKEMTGMQFLSRFERSVLEIKNNGLNQTEEFTNTKLEMRGWR